MAYLTAALSSATDRKYNFITIPIVNQTRDAAIGKNVLLIHDENVCSTIISHSVCKFSEKLVSQNCPTHLQIPCPLHQQHHTLKIMCVSYLYAILMAF